jgi:hypothetical protein
VRVGARSPLPRTDLPQSDTASGIFFDYGNAVVIMRPPGRPLGLDGPRWRSATFRPRREDQASSSVAASGTGAQFDRCLPFMRTFVHIPTTALYLFSCRHQIFSAEVSVRARKEIRISGNRRLDSGGGAGSRQVEDFCDEFGESCYPRDKTSFRSGSLAAPRVRRPLVRVRGLPRGFSQPDFGEQGRWCRIGSPFCSLEQLGREALDPRTASAC